MSGRVRVLRDGGVCREGDGTFVVPLTVAESGRGPLPAVLRLAPGEAELLHAQFTRALDPPVDLPPSPWLGRESHEDPTGWP